MPSYSKKFVSIAMATYNGEEYLKEQLNSFAMQSRLPDELVICDDCSSDETILIIEEFIRISPFSVRLIKNSINLGYIKNFEKALSLCTGELIFLSDQDDVWFSEKIQCVENTFNESEDTLLVVHDGKIVDERLNWNGATSLSQVRSGFGGDEHLITGNLSVIHKDLLRCILPFPNELAEITKIGHDGWIHLIAKFMGTRRVIASPLMLIRRHSLNTSAWIASSTAKISKITVFFAHFKTSPAISYQDRIYLNEALQERLVYADSHGVSEATSSAIDVSLSYLKSERQAISYRSAILTAGFLTRRWKSLRMLIGGHYKYFNGFNSFLRDFVR